MNQIFYIDNIVCGIVNNVLMEEDKLPVDLFILSTMNCWLGGKCFAKDMITFELCNN